MISLHPINFDWAAFQFCCSNRERPSMNNPYASASLIVTESLLALHRANSLWAHYAALLNFLTAWNLALSFYMMLVLHALA